MDLRIWGPLTGQVTVWAGDFNINLLKDDESAKDADIFNQFKIDMKYGVRRDLINPYSATTTTPPSVFYTRNQAQPSAYLKKAVYDYGFVTYGKNSRPAILPSAVIIDRVAGVTPGGQLPPFTTDMWVSLKLLSSNFGKDDDGPPIYAPSRIVNIADEMGSASRTNEITTIKTKTVHGITPGDIATVTVSSSGTFNGNFVVKTTPTLWSFTYKQKDKGNATGGGGTVDALPRLNVFRTRFNFAHIGPPAGQGTSDHLPVLMIV
jgi:hypothetical protein